MQSLKSRYYFLTVKQQLLSWNRLGIVERRIAYEEAAIARKNFAKQVDLAPFLLEELSGEWIKPWEKKNKGIIIYLHGGAYALGSALSHRAIGSHLAVAAGCDVLMLNYRLAPEHPYPAALEDVVNTFNWLKSNMPTRPVAIAGDSAGGGLALAATIKMRGKFSITPVALGLFSPWTDLALTNPSHQSNAKFDPYFPNSERLMGAAHSYAGDGSLFNPLISPQYANFKSFPPMLIHVGDTEALLDDSKLLHQQATSMAVNCELKIWPQMWHVWQYFAGKMPEATKSVHEMGLFLQKNLQS